MSLIRRLMVFMLLASAAFAAQWTPASAGLTGSIPAVSALVVDHSTGSTLYALTSLTPLRAGADAIDIFNVFKSTDGGANWKALANIARVNVVAIDPISTSTIYAGTAKRCLQEHGRRRELGLHAAARHVDKRIGDRSDHAI